MHPILGTALVDGHRRDLLAQAGHSRPRRAVRSADESRVAARRLVVPRDIAATQQDHSTTLWRICATAAIFLASFLAVSGEQAAAQTVPSLAGEVLEGPYFGGTGTVSASCDATGVSTVTWITSGPAVGPYPGTFDETLTLTIGPQTTPKDGSPSGFVGIVTSVTATFSIMSPVGTVTGSKTLYNDTDATGYCISDSTVLDQRTGLVNSTGTITNVTLGSLAYKADIYTPTGAASDSGVANASGAASNVSGTDPVTGQTVYIDRNPPMQFYESFNFSFGVVLIDTPGKATGGGQIEGTGGPVSFGFNAKSDTKGLKGECTVIDHATNRTIKCLDVLSYSQTGSTATFSGHATVAGVNTTYRITVQDNGEPGIGKDTFSITTGSGYSATGVLTEGGIQVHS